MVFIIGIDIMLLQANSDYALFVKDGKDLIEQKENGKECINGRMDIMWTKKWPNKEGNYWFYGYRYGRISIGQKCDPEYVFVKARKISNGLLIIGDGQIMYSSEVEEAWWKKIDMEKDVGIPEKFDKGEYHGI